jgi:hypothetical protein
VTFCQVCYAALDTTFVESMNAGIAVLLGVTVVVLGCFARFFLVLARRSRENAHLVGYVASDVASGFSRTVEENVASDFSRTSQENVVSGFRRTHEGRT